mmetsp:Transcript_22844/g.33735  ORF Transcript_22844/g.33735 Transcript_22844/m.33735 type:complete len:211 (+) Transcript_22844:275-907(+)
MTNPIRGPEWSNAVVTRNSIKLQEFTSSEMELHLECCDNNEASEELRPSLLGRIMETKTLSSRSLSPPRRQLIAKQKSITATPKTKSQKDATHKEDSLLDRFSDMIKGRNYKEVEKVVESEEFRTLQRKLRMSRSLTNNSMILDPKLKHNFVQEEKNKNTFLERFSSMMKGKASNDIEEVMASREFQLLEAEMDSSGLLGNDLKTRWRSC